MARGVAATVLEEALTVVAQHAAEHASLHAALHVALHEILQAVPHAVVHTVVHAVVHAAVQFAVAADVVENSVTGFQPAATMMSDSAITAWSGGKSLTGATPVNRRAGPWGLA